MAKPRRRGRNRRGAGEREKGRGETKKKKAAAEGSGFFLNRSVGPLPSTAPDYIFVGPVRRLGYPGNKHCPCKHLPYY